MPVLSKVFRCGIAAGLLSCLLLAPAVNAETSGTKRTALQVLDRFHSAMRTKQPNIVIESLAPEVIVFEQGFSEEGRDQWVRSQMAATMAFAEASDRQIVRRESHQDGSYAWVLSNLITTLDSGERKLQLEGVETAVLKKNANNQWEITHLHWSAHPVQTEEPEESAAEPAEQ